MCLPLYPKHLAASCLIAEREMFLTGGEKNNLVFSRCEVYHVPKNVNLYVAMLSEDQEYH